MKIAKMDAVVAWKYIIDKIIMLSRSSTRESGVENITKTAFRT